MKWTKEFPNRIGHYWVRYMPNDPYPQIHFARDLKDVIGITVHDGIFRFESEMKKKFPDIEYSDSPIPEPEEP